MNPAEAGASLAAPGRLDDRRYGKLGLRVIDVRDQDRQVSPVRVDVAVSVEGGLDGAYLGQGNEGVVPSDCLRAAALACMERRLAGGAPLVPDLGPEIAQALLRDYPALPGATVKIRELRLGLVRRSGPNRIYVVGAAGSRPHAYSLPVTTWFCLERDAVGDGRTGSRQGGGQRDLSVVLHGRHRFTGFDAAAMAVRPPSAGLRSLVGKLRYRWEDAPGTSGADERAEDLLDALLNALAEDSESVQHLLARAAGQVLGAGPHLGAVTVSFRSRPVVPVTGLDLPQAVIVEQGPVAVTSVRVAR